MASYELFNMAKAQGCMKHIQHKEIQKLTQQLNQKNAEIHLLNIHIQQIMHTNQSYAEWYQNLKQTVAAYEQNCVASELHLYRKIESHLAVKEEWQKISVSKIEAFYLKYTLALNELTDFLSFYQNVRKSLPSESLSAMENLID